MTDKEWISVPVDQAASTIKEFLPVDGDDDSEYALQIVPGGKTLSNIQNIIMDNIDRVIADPKSIPQVNAVNDSIGTLINLAKLELQAMKLRRKSR